MSRNQLYALLFVVLPVAYWLSTPVSLIDLSFWLHYGRDFLSGSSSGVGFPSTDQISFVSQGPIVFPQLVVIVYATIEELFGFWGVVLLHPISLFLLLFAWAKQVKDQKLPVSNRLILLFGFALFGMASSWTERPALFGFVFAALTYQRVVQKKWQTQRQIIGLAALGAAWFLTHASYPVFLLILLWSQLWSYSRNAVAVVVIFTAAVFLVPGSMALVFESFRVFTFATGSEINEWALWSGSQFGFQSYLFLILLMTVFWTQRHKPRDFVKDPFFPILLLGFLGVRHSFWGFWLLIPWALNQKDFFPKSLVSHPPRKINLALNSVVAFMAVLLLLVNLPPMKQRFIAYWPPKKLKLIQFKVPETIIESLNTDTQLSTRRIFNEVNWGADLTLNQVLPIFIDGRDHLYPKSVTDDYAMIMSGHPFALDTLEKYKITDVVISRGRTSLIQAFQITGVWQLVHQEGFLSHYRKRAQNPL